MGASAPAGYKIKDIAPDVNSLLTVAEAAGRMGVCVATIYCKVREHIFHPLRKDGRYLIPPHEIDAEIERVAGLRKLPSIYGGSRGRLRGRPTLADRDREDSQASSSPVGKYKPANLGEESSHSPNASSLNTSTGGNHSTANANGNPPSIKTREDDSGKNSALAFKAFDAGKTARDIVKDLELPPVAAEYLWFMYCKLGREWVLPNPSLSKFRHLLSWEEDPPTPAGFEQAMRIFIAKEVERELERELASRSPLPVATSESPLPFAERPLTETELRELEEAEKEAIAERDIARKAKAAAAAVTPSVP